MARSLKVAVIGAGLSGLVTARELQREGHRVVVFEKEDRIGGTWVYDPRVEDDPLSLDLDRQIVHGSLYLSLRTNLPRHIMGFLDYPFTAKDFGDSRTFPGHQEVHSFLKEFAKDFGLNELIRFNTEVIRVERVNDEWVVESRTRESGSEEVFEAVVVCNGHHTEPLVADLPGIEKWTRKQIHSHNYRIPEPFRDQIVVIIGSGPSACDISKDISKVAKEVHMSSRSPDVKVSKLDNYDNIWQHSMVDFVYEDGTVAFQDGSSVQADIIFYCTGYKLNFPFLNINGIVSVEDNHVGPLYKHVFPPQLAPGLSFVGIPQRVIISLSIELQAKWISHVLSGKVLLPSEVEMLANVEEYYRHMEESGKPKHHTHTLHPNEFEYLDWLLAQVGLPPLEKQIKGIYREALKFIASHEDDGFRDKWDVDDWINAEFT